MPADFDRCVQKAKKQFVDKGIKPKNAESKAYAVCTTTFKKAGKRTEMSNLNFNYSVPITEQGMLGDDFFIAGIAINATTTSNNHKFIEGELRNSANTLIGVPLLTDHENKVENIKGRVVHAEYNEEGRNIPFKANVKDKTIRQMIKDELIDSVSVGAHVRPEDIEEVDGVLIPHNIIFKELSLVAVPADEKATFNIALKEAYEDYKSYSSEDDILNNNCKEVKMTEVKEQEEQQAETSETEETKEEPKPEAEEKTEATEEMIRRILREELKALKEADADEKPAEPEKEPDKEPEKEPEKDVSEGYNYEEGYGTLKGGSYTLIR
jgi:hypothetical protein